MPRKAAATAVDQIDACARCYAAFACTSPDLRMTTARRAYAAAGARPCQQQPREADASAYFRAFSYFMQQGEMKIDYLDIVLIKPQAPSAGGATTGGSARLQMAGRLWHALA